MTKLVICTKRRCIVGKNAFDNGEENKDLGKTGQVLMRLLDRGHHLYVDNWYTSTALFKEFTFLYYHPEGESSSFVSIISTVSEISPSITIPGDSSPSMVIPSSSTQLDNLSLIHI